MALKKQVREEVWLKYDKHCAYCGNDLEYKKMQVDHIEPHWHSMIEDECIKYGITKGSNEIGNLNPSCARCNKWKGTYSVEQFRIEIQLQLDRLFRYSSSYKLALDYGMVIENRSPILFYFEK